jgi:hypothetical protein
MSLTNKYKSDWKVMQCNIDEVLFVRKNYSNNYSKCLVKRVVTLLLRVWYDMVKSCLVVFYIRVSLFLLTCDSWFCPHYLTKISKDKSHVMIQKSGRPHILMSNVITTEFLLYFHYLICNMSCCLILVEQTVSINFQKSNELHDQLLLVMFIQHLQFHRRKEDQLYPDVKFQTTCLQWVLIGSMGNFSIPYFNSLTINISINKELSLICKINLINNGCTIPNCLKTAGFFSTCTMCIWQGWNLKLCTVFCTLSHDNPVCWEIFSETFMVIITNFHRCFLQIHHATLKGERTRLTIYTFCVTETIY